MLFRPHLAQLFGRRMSLLHFLRHPQAEGALLPVGSGRWVFARPTTAMPTPAEWTAMLRIATGRPDLEPELLRAQQFTMAADLASTYRAGPGFLVGDAAHRMTPAGGVGLNTAMHDGHELGWRIGWVTRGFAGDALLHGWAQEREPVGRANAERSLRMDDRDSADGLPGDLGRTYRSTVIADDGGPAAPLGHRTARPGERAPHVWVRQDGRRTSTLDLFERRLTLLAGSLKWDRPAGQHVQVLVPATRSAQRIPVHRGAV